MFKKKKKRNATTAADKTGPGNRNDSTEANVPACGRIAHDSWPIRAGDPEISKGLITHFSLPLYKNNWIIYSSPKKTTYKTDTPDFKKERKRKKSPPDVMD